MTHVLFWVAAACCVVAQIAILHSVFTAEPASTAGEGVPRPARSIELLWVTIPALVLILVLAFTWRAI